MWLLRGNAEALVVSIVLTALVINKFLAIQHFHTSASFDPISSALVFTSSAPSSVHVLDNAVPMPSHITSSFSLPPLLTAPSTPNLRENVVTGQYVQGSTSPFGEYLQQPLAIPAPVSSAFSSSQISFNQTLLAASETTNTEFSRTLSNSNEKRNSSLPLDPGERLILRSTSENGAPAKGHRPTSGNSTHHSLTECSSPPGPVAKPSRPLLFNQVAFFVNSSPDGRR